MREEALNYRAVCAHCRFTRGQHRYGDEACRNPHWRAGNGLPQWLTLTFTENSTPLLDKLKRWGAPA